MRFVRRLPSLHKKGQTICVLMKLLQSSRTYTCGHLRLQLLWFWEAGDEDPIGMRNVPRDGVFGGSVAAGAQSGAGGDQSNPLDLGLC